MIGCRELLKDEEYRTMSVCADTIITNAVIYTVEPSRPRAEALAIKDGTILAVGSTAGMEAYRSHDTEVWDMGGRFVLPGFVDAHMHPAQSAVNRMYGAVLSDIKGKEGYLTRIRDFAGAHRDWPVIEGRGFYRADFDQMGPRREWLDEIDNTRPILVTSVDGHSMWVNTAALTMAGITKDTPDPENGVIQRDEQGVPTGLLQESAMALMDPLKTRYTKEQYKEAILELQQYLHSRGITYVFDAMVPTDNPDYYMAYQELAESGELSLRIRGAWHIYPGMAGGPDENIEKAMELSKGFSSPYFQINAFKFFADQVVEEETAYLSAPYSHRDDGWRGIREWPVESLKRLFQAIDGAGYQIHIHAIGDGAVHDALDAIEYAQERNGKRDARHALAHIQCVGESDRDRMARLNAAAVAAPYWMVVDDYFWEFNVPYLGMDRVRDTYPYKSLIDRGVHVAVHSDFSVTEPDYPALFYTAMKRTLPPDIFVKYHGESGAMRGTDPGAPLDERVYGPLPPASEGVSLAEAIRSATYEGAWALKMDADAGTIAPGKRADFAVFDEDFFGMDPEDFHHNPVVMTVAGGKVVYDGGK